MELYYTHLNIKLDNLQAKQWQQPNTLHKNGEQHQSYARVKKN